MNRGRKKKKITQISEEDEELQFLLQKRGDYLVQLQSTTFDSNSCLSPSISDDSESSDEEPDNLSKVHFKSESSERDTDVKQNVQTNDECVTEENAELNVNIKHELIDEKIDSEEVNDIGSVEHVNDETVVNGETIGQEEVENTAANEENEMEEENNDRDEQLELKTDGIKINEQQQQQQDNVKEDESSNSSGTVIIKQSRGKKFKRTVAVEGDQTSQMDSGKQIDIKQEHAEYNIELDPLEDMVDDDGVRRELRPRKLNDSHIYFEPYDGSLSGESDDFTDLLSD